MRGSTRRGRPSFAGTCPRATRPRPRPRPPRSTRRSAISAPSTCAPSASCARGSSTRRIGPTPGRRTSRCCASAGGSSSGRAGAAIGARPTTSSSPSTRGWRSAPVCTRRRDCASPRWSRWPTTARSRRARPRCRLRLGDPGDRGGPARGGDRARRRHRPHRHRVDGRQRPPEPTRPPRARPARSLPSGEPPFDVVLANLIAGVLVPLAGALRDELAVGGTLVASGIFIDRETEVRGAFAAAGLSVGRPIGRGRVGRAPCRPIALTGLTAPALQSSPRCRPTSRLLLATHIVLAISLFLPSILLPFALRTRRATVESDSRVVRTLLWGQTHGTLVDRRGLALTGLGLIAVLGPPDAAADVAAARADDLLRQPRDRVLHPATEPAAAHRDQGGRRRQGVARRGPRRQRYVSYLMAGLVGTIGFLMSSKPVLW